MSEGEGREHQMVSSNHEKKEQSKRDITTFISPAIEPLVEEYKTVNPKFREMEEVRNSTMSKIIDKEDGAGRERFDREYAEVKKRNQELEMRMEVLNHLEQKLGGKLEATEDQFQGMMRMLEEKMTEQLRRDPLNESTDSMKLVIEEDLLLRCLSENC